MTAACLQRIDRAAWLNSHTSRRVHARDLLKRLRYSKCADFFSSTPLTLQFHGDSFLRQLLKSHRERGQFRDVASSFGAAPKPHNQVCRFGFGSRIEHTLCRKSGQSFIPHPVVSAESTASHVGCAYTGDILSDRALRFVPDRCGGCRTRNQTTQRFGPSIDRHVADATQWYLHSM